MSDCWLDVDLRNIAWNLEQIRRRVARPVMAVIKANAYGHGLVEVGRFLESRGVEFLAVGKASEAFALRDAGVGARILNFGPFTGAEALALVQRGVSQSVYTDDVRALAEAARTHRTRGKVHVKVDTGLGRVGVRWDRAVAFLETVAATPGIEIEGIFTTFTEDPDFDRVQLERFLGVCRAAAARDVQVGIRHAASSAGVLAFEEAHLDMVRPGITIYGHYPSTQEAEARKIELRPAMSLRARVTCIKELRPGDAVSYHRAFVATRPTRVATLGIGYADGYPHQAAGRARVLLGGRRCPSIALVTSNHMTVDAGDLEVETGDEAALFGEQGRAEISAQELGAWAQSSVYKILIGMSPLLPRRYGRP